MERHNESPHPYLYCHLFNYITRKIFSLPRDTAEKKMGKKKVVLAHTFK